MGYVSILQDITGSGSEALAQGCTIRHTWCSQAEQASLSRASTGAWERETRVRAGAASRLPHMEEDPVCRATRVSPIEPHVNASRAKERRRERESRCCCLASLARCCRSCCCCCSRLRTCVLVCNLCPALHVLQNLLTSPVQCLSLSFTS